MSIEKQAAIETAKVVGVCVGGAGCFGFLMVFLPWVALAVAFGALVYFVYQLKLDEVRFQERLDQAAAQTETPEEMVKRITGRDY